MRGYPARLVGWMATALGTLKSPLSSKSEQVRLRAATALLGVPERDGLLDRPPARGELEHVREAEAGFWPVPWLDAAALTARR